MKELIIATGIFLISMNNLLSQNSHIITLGLNKYHNTLYDYTKSYGTSLGYEYERKINESVIVKVGLIGNVALEKNIKIYPTHVNASDSAIYNPNNDKYIISSRWIDESSGWSLSLQIPINIKIKLFHPKLFMTGGIMFSIDNLWVDSQISSSDPSTQISRGIVGDLNKDWPITSLLGFGHQIGLIYDFSKKFEIFGEFKTSTNKEFTFNYFEIGFKFKINKSIETEY